MKQEICLALGFFDSVHYGHREIIKKLKQNARGLGCISAISTFSDSFCTQGLVSDRLIYTFSERAEILSELGIDEVLMFDFDEEFKNLTKQDFILLLQKKYKLRYVICGYDYRFGRGGQGNIDTLLDFCKSNGIVFEVVDKVCMDGERVSSSRIRQQLSLGDIESANRLLVGEFFINAEVVRGRGEGAKNGFPTANLLPKLCKLSPKCGVYATKTLVEGKLYNSLTNVGARPSYDDYSHGIETYIDGFCGDLYGKQIKVFFHKYLREIKKFDTKKQLAHQISKDLLDIRN